MTTGTPDDNLRPLSRREAREAAARADETQQPAASPHVQAPDVPIIVTSDVQPRTRPSTTPADPNSAQPTTVAANVDPPAVPVSAGTSDTAPIAARSDSRPATQQEEAPSEADDDLVFPGLLGTPARGAGGDTQQTGASKDLDGEASLTDLFDAKAERPKKRGGGCLVPMILIIAIVGGLTAAGFWAWNTYGTQIQSFFAEKTIEDYKDGEATGEVKFTINPGDTGLQISNALHEAGVTKGDTTFYDWLRENPPTPTFYPGTYPLQEKMTAKAVVEVLGNVENKTGNSVLLREGETLEIILPAIAESLQIPIEDLQAAVADPAVYGVAAETLEGWLFPATYEFEEDVSAADVITRMVNRTVESLDAAGVPANDRQRILNIAAIIQREAGPGDMGKVSRVIYNRLLPDNEETHGKLQMDSTVAYGVGKLHGGVVATTLEDRENDNPYNTYLYPGLPKAPIANAGDEAIAAAMNPTEGPWMYFVTVDLNTGETLFSNTYDEQLVNEAKWHDWCKANPDAGCYE